MSCARAMQLYDYVAASEIRRMDDVVRTGERMRPYFVTAAKLQSPLIVAPSRLGDGCGSCSPLIP